MSQHVNMSLENRMQVWICTRLGMPNAHRRERAMRLLEEAVELAQSEGVTLAQAVKQTEYVFSRPPGEPSQEAAGVAVCLLGWCAATGCTMVELAEREIERIENKPLDQIRGSLARKRDADLVTVVEELQ